MPSRARVIALLLVLLLAGCLPPSTTATSPLPSLSPVVSSPAATPTTSAPEPPVVTLTLWVPADLNPYEEGPGGMLLAQQLDGFGEAYPALQVEVIVKKAHGRGGVLDFLRTAGAAAPSVLPDLVVLDVDDMQVAARAGLLQPLDDILPAELTADRFSFAIGLGEVEGQVMAVPLAVELEHLAYRPALLASPPLSWTDVLSAGIPFVFPAAGQNGGVNDATLAQYLGAGGRLTDGESNPSLEEEPLTAVLDFYAQASSAGVISPTVVLSLADSEACWEVFQGWQAGIAVVNSRRFWTNADLYAALAPIPTQDGRGVALARGWTLALVTADAKRQEQVIQLLAWLLDPQRHGAWTQGAGYLPVTRGGLAAWAITEEERVSVMAVLEAARPAPFPAVQTTVGPALQEALEAVLTGRRSPADAAADAARAVEP